MRIPLDDHYCLRQYRRRDHRALVKHADDPAIARELRDRFPHPYTREDAVEWIRHVATRPVGSILAIANDKELIGSIGVERREDVYRRSAELGYWLGRAFWGRGITTAAVRAMCEFAFARSDLERIQAHVFESNIASCRVLEKVGFKLDGVHRRAVFKNGGFVNERVYGLLRRDPRPGR